MILRHFCYKGDYIEMTETDCPWCHEKVMVEYGYKVRCPKCHKKCDHFPDFDLWLSTPWGVVGVNLAQVASVLPALLAIQKSR